MTTTRTYPYKAWVLMPSFKPAEVELVKRHCDWSSADYGDATASGKPYSTSDLHPSRSAAIARGWALIDKQSADLAKSLETLKKKRAALRKAEAP